MASTFVTAIGAVALYDPVLNDTGYILGPGDDTGITLGALLEFFLMIGNVGTAVVMFPILKRYSETLSLSYVASRSTTGPSCSAPGSASGSTASCWAG